MKDQTIIIRVDAATKRRIEEAARRLGLTTTTFLIQAGEKAASRVRATLKTHKKPNASGACPGYFKACCIEAKRGGSDGYARAAYELTRHIVSELDYCLDDDDCGRVLGELEGLIDDTDDVAVLNWFAAQLPRCMALVPNRRRGSFVQGVYRFVEDNGFPG